MGEKHSGSILSGNWLGWHVCRTKLARKIFVEAGKNLTKNAPKFSPKCLRLLFCGSEKIPPNFPQDFPPKNKIKNLPTSFCRGAGTTIGQWEDKFSGKSKWGLSNGGLRPLSAICTQSSTIVHFCGLFGPLSKGNFRRKMTTVVGNRGQLWTSTLSPHLESPWPFRLSRSFAARHLDVSHGPLLTQEKNVPVELLLVSATLAIAWLHCEDARPAAYL